MELQELQGQERFRATQAGKLEKLYEGLKGKAEKLRPAKEAKEKELVPLQKKLTEVKQVVEVAQAEAGFLRKRQERRKMTTEGKDRIKKLATEIEKVSKDVAAARAKADEARSEFEQEILLGKEHFRGRLIQAVNEQAKAGRLKGVYGRLGDLGSINKKYDIAVSTACGMLDAIVVESTEDAQAVIEFVRGQD
eukprot:s208_g5.t1